MECSNGFTISAVITPKDSDLVEEAADIILDEIQAVGETIHTIMYEEAGKRFTSYYFLVFMRGLRKIGLYYDTKDQAVVRRSELLKILGEYRAGKYQHLLAQ